MRSVFLVFFLLILVNVVSCKSTNQTKITEEKSTKEHSAPVRQTEVPKTKVDPPPQPETKVSFVKQKKSSSSELSGLNRLFDTVDVEEYELGAHKLFAIELNIPILFEFDSSNLGNVNVEEVALLADIYKTNSLGTYLYVVGHTDSIGKQQYNQSLSAKRALVVAQLLSNNGVPPKSIKLVPAGEVLPKYSNSQPEGRAQNRRVEIFSADSQELLKAYLRELDCEKIDDACVQSYLPINGVKVKQGSLVIDSDLNNQLVVTQAPEVNNLKELNDALERDLAATDRNYLSKPEQERFLNVSPGKREPLTIKPEIRESLNFLIDVRKLLILPAKYYFEEKKS